MSVCVNCGHHVEKPHGITFHRHARWADYKCFCGCVKPERRKEG